MEAETVFIVLQLIHEVTIAGSISAGYDGDMLTEHRQLEFLLEFKDALLLQLADNLHALTCHVAHRVGGIDIGDYPRKAITLMKLGIYLQQRLHTRMNLLTGNAHEMGLHQLPRGSPTFRRSLGHRRIGVLVLLDEFHIAMATHLAGFRQLCLHPILIRHLEGERLTHQRVQFIERQGVLHGLFLSLSRILPKSGMP